MNLEGLFVMMKYLAKYVKILTGKITMNLLMFGKINLNQTENSGHFVMNSKF